MSSNPADRPTASGCAPARGSWSLTARLAVATSVTSFIILTVISLQMYHTLSGHLRELNSRYLRDELETLGQMSRLAGFGEALADEMHVDPVGEDYLTHYVRLLDRDGRTVIATPNMQSRLPRELFPPATSDGRDHETVELTGKDGAAYLLSAIRTSGRGAGGPDEILQVALDVTNVEKVLAAYRKKLALILGVGFLLCTASGVAIARRGTRPLREITAQACEITSARLDDRLNGADWPRELNSLAGALNGMLDRLQDSFTRVYCSVANLSHKLRTPITILKGEAEVALARERTAEELREVIASSMEEFGRLTHLVDNIVFISQAEAGKLQHVLIKIKAREEIDKVLDFYGPLLEEKGIAVTCEGNATLAADPTLFRKAVAHLISNARTYSKPGGSIAITVRQRNESAEVSVTDTGCGIAAEEMSKIFDRFYRVYDSRFMDPHGSGLGLPLVKTIMDLHHGTIEITSLPGEGTTALLTFPQSVPAASRNALK